MNAISDAKKLFGIIGLPRSGTTILCNFFNSFTNGFCFSEPHWTFFQGMQPRFDKVQDLTSTSAVSLMDDISHYLHASDQYVLGGIKETYWKGRKHLSYLLNFPVDFFIFLFREPCANFASLVRDNPGLKPDFFSTCYKDLFEIYLSIPDRNKIAFVYENFCDDPLAYVNTHLEGRLQIAGPLALKKTNYLHGDPVAKFSETVHQASSKYEDVVSTADMKFLNENTLPVYNKIILKNNMTPM